MVKHAKRLARAKKAGFSLVELIIVIAIMVALVSVMAPAFVKYVNKSHDAVVEAAAESVLQFVKAEMADGSLTGVGKIKVYGAKKTDSDERKYIKVEWQRNDEGFSLAYHPEGLDVTGDGENEFKMGCGVDDNKQIKSDLVYEIEVKDTQTVSGHPNKIASMEVVDPENP